MIILKDLPYDKNEQTKQIYHSNEQLNKTYFFITACI